MRRAIIDGDILVNEVGFGSQRVIDGEIIPNDWEWVRELCANKIKFICEEAEADTCLIFLTNRPFISTNLNKRRIANEEEPVEYVENFRKALSKEREYKGHRSSVRPFHFDNLYMHLIGSYNTYVVENGTEADDAIATYQLYSPPETTIICSRDKDLRQIPGWYYSWECHNQEAWGPLLITKTGFLEKITKNRLNQKGEMKPVEVYRGVGDLFLYFQMITGDSTDNIIGVKGRNKVFAYNLLKDVTSSREAERIVKELYMDHYKEKWKEMWNEMYNLLYIRRSIS